MKNRIKRPVYDCLDIPAGKHLRLLALSLTG